MRRRAMAKCASERFGKGPSTPLSPAHTPVAAMTSSIAMYCTEMAWINKTFTGPLLPSSAWAGGLSDAIMPGASI